MVRDAFFDLEPEVLGYVFRLYEYQYGRNAGSYARSAYTEWQSGQKRPSIQTLNRLMSVVPHALPFPVKLTLFRTLRARELPPDRVSITRRGTVDLELVRRELDRMTRRIKEATRLLAAGGSGNAYESLRWLSDNDGMMMQQLLHAADETEGQALKVAADHELRDLASRLSELARTKQTTRLTHTITLRGGVIAITIDPTSSPAQGGIMAPDESTGQSRKDKADSSASLAPLSGNGDLINAILAPGVSEETRSSVAKTIVDEEVRLRMAAKEAQLRSTVARADMDEFMNNAERGSRTGTTFSMSGTFEQASGRTTIQVENKPSLVARVGSTVGLVILIVAVVIVAVAVFGR